MSDLERPPAGFSWQNVDPPAELESDLAEMRDLSESKPFAHPNRGSIVRVNPRDHDVLFEARGQWK